MKPRHAAALALVGWYLMVPPLFKKGIDLNAPPSQWEHRQAFDTADRCESTKDDLVRCAEILNNAMVGNVKQACGFEGKTRHEIRDRDQEEIVVQMAFQFMEARCIATDDPGLKAN